MLLNSFWLPSLSEYLKQFFIGEEVKSGKSRPFAI